MSLMKRALLLVAGFAASLLQAVAVKVQGPGGIAAVIDLLKEMQTQTTADFKKEQQQYDKYACWCEETVGRKAQDIQKGTAEISELGAKIMKTGANLAAEDTNIKFENKKLAANLAEEKSAVAMRDQDAKEYRQNVINTKNSIEAMQNALKALAGAGTAKKGFLETLQERQVVEAAAAVKEVLKESAMTSRFPEQQIEMVVSFADKPNEYIRGHTPVLSAAQLGVVNPHGDYAPKSTQITGILGAMLDSFRADLKKLEEKETESKKSFKDLSNVKSDEERTLRKSLRSSNLNAADSKLALADDKETKDDTTEAVTKDTDFLERTKKSCTKAAEMWSVRSRLRTEEMNGIAQALSILTSDKSAAILKNATTNFLQIASVETGSDSRKAYSHVKEIATRYKCLSLAKIAVAIKSGSHFDKVITMIDNMIGLLRKESMDDIQHRDRCQEQQNANRNSIDTIQHKLTKVTEKLDRLGSKKDELTNNLELTKKEISTSEKSMDDLTQMRESAAAEFQQAVQDDTAAVAILTKVIGVLSKFYTDNGIALLQKSAQPQYSVKAPKNMPFEDASYGGKQTQSNGIVGFIEVMRDNLKKEIKTGTADEAKAQEEYEEDLAALKESLSAQEKKKSDIENSLVELKSKIEDDEEFKQQRKTDMEAEKSVKKSLKTDCGWVKTHFDKRSQQRKSEMDGLADAKEFLTGVETGAAVLAPLPMQ